MKLEALLEELKNNLNRMNDREAMDIFIKSLNISGLIYGGHSSIKQNTYKMKVSFINGRNTSIILFYVCVVFIMKETQREIVSVRLEPLKCSLSSFENILETVNKLKKQFLQKYKEESKKYLMLAKRLNVSDEVAIQLGEAFYRLNSNSRDILLQKEDAYNLIYGINVKKM